LLGPDPIAFPDTTPIGPVAKFYFPYFVNEPALIVEGIFVLYPRAG